MKYKCFYISDLPTFELPVYKDKSVFLSMKIWHKTWLLQFPVVDAIREYLVEWLNRNYRIRVILVEEEAMDTGHVMITSARNTNAHMLSLRLELQASLHTPKGISTYVFTT